MAGVLSLVAILYSWDYLRLAVTGDVPRFNRATWYWPAYDWANRNTPKTARFAVILYGGHTYPLNRWNVSGDPGSSAAIPWERIENGCDFVGFLRDARVDFVFYGPNVWTGEPMTARLARAVGEAADVGALDLMRSFDVPIVYGRMARLERHTTVRLYHFDPSRAVNGCPHR